MRDLVGRSLGLLTTTFLFDEACSLILSHLGCARAGSGCGTPTLNRDGMPGLNSATGSAAWQLW